ncbi:MAG: arginine--tRNA ligase [Chitinophagaceae bacterium]|nr:arginine--tRNA ligase [Chitinophagaceae bacterium]
MQIADIIRQLSIQALKAVFDIEATPESLTINETKPEFTGDYTLVLFPFVKQARKSPDVLGASIGEWMQANAPEIISGFETVKGFLNLSVSNQYWVIFLQQQGGEHFGMAAPHGKKVMVEYSSPNTNKPLHLGHLRNNFLGWSVAEIYKANGYNVMKSCVVNDRGIHICKSMLAWQKFGNGATPATTQTKGDHLVGDYYVKFENELRSQSEPVLHELLEGRAVAGMDEAALQKAKLLVAKLSDGQLPDDKQSEIRDELKDMARNAT